MLVLLITLSTRWGGVYVMSSVPIGYRVRQFIGAMSGSVLVAILAPMSMQGDNAARLALGRYSCDHAAIEEAVTRDCGRHPDCCDIQTDLIR